MGDKGHGAQANGYHSDDQKLERRLSRAASSKVNRAVFRTLNPFGKRQANEPRWFNPEDFTEQKRAWAKQNASADSKVVGWPARLFESFLIAGLPPSSNITSVVAEPEVAQRAKGQRGAVEYAVLPEASKEARHRGKKGKPLPPQVLYQYPEDRPLPPDVGAFCFPHGVQPTLLERSPSMSALNELVYSQHYQHSDAASFIFMQKVADDLPLYGVCCYMEEVVHRPPAILADAPGAAAPAPQQPLAKFLVAAPRCYCLLTHYPFFTLHLKVLHMIMGLERLDRITAFMREQAEGPSRASIASTPAGSLRAPHRRSVSRSSDAALAHAQQVLAESRQRSGQPSPEKAQQAPQARQAQQGPGAASGPAAPASAGVSVPEPEAQVGPQGPRAGAALAEGEGERGRRGAPAGEEEDKRGLEGREGGSEEPLPPDEGVCSSSSTGAPTTSPTSTLSSAERASARRALSAQQAPGAKSEKAGSAGLQRLFALLQQQGKAGEGPKEVAVPAQPAQPQQAPDPFGAFLGASGASRAVSAPEAAAEEGAGEEGEASPEGMRAGQEEAGLATPEASRRGAGDASSLPVGLPGGTVFQTPRGAPAGFGAELATPGTRYLTPPSERSPSSGQPWGAEAESTPVQRPGLVSRRSLRPGPERPPGAGASPDVLRRASARMRAAFDAAGSGLDRAEEGGEAGASQPQGANRAPSGGLPPELERLSSYAPTEGGDSGGNMPLGDGAEESLASFASALSFFPQQEPEGRAGAGAPTGARLDPSGLVARLSGTQRAPRGALLKSISLRDPTGQTLQRPSPDPGAAPRGDPATALQVMQEYHATPVPAPGEELEFFPDPSLQPMHFRRGGPRGPEEGGSPKAVIHRTAVAAAESEAAEGLRDWSVAVLCRVLSLDSILTLLTCALLERQLVFFCPNIGVLTSCVLALVPLLRPYAWQCLLLPVLPAHDAWLGLLEAPVPFILGVQYKTPEVAAQCAGLVRVNLYKDRVKNTGRLPPLPNQAGLAAALAPSYEALRAAGQDNARHRPVYAATDAQRAAARTFSKVVHDYMGDLSRDLQLHTITDVRTAERVALLLKDSFIESWPPEDRPFIRAFAETQLFSVYSDSVIV